MLVLSRKIGERIFIEPGIEIAIVDVRGSRVSIGVRAPDDIRIRRVNSPQESGNQIRRAEADLLTASPGAAE